MGMKQKKNFLKKKFYVFTGGFKLELLDSKENLIRPLTPEKGGSKSDGWIDKDTTAQSYLVSFPSELNCEGCTVRPNLHLYTYPK